MKAKYAQEWTDYQLSWDSSEFGGVSSIRIDPRMVWTPDLLLYNRCTNSTLHLPVSQAGE